MKEKLKQGLSVIVTQSFILYKYLYLVWWVCVNGFMSTVAAPQYSYNRDTRKYFKPWRVNWIKSSWFLVSYHWYHWENLTQLRSLLGARFEKEKNIFIINHHYQAVSEYFSELSWRKLLLNMVDPGLNDIIDDHQRTAEFDNTADWSEAVTKTLARQRWVKKKIFFSF